MAKITIVGNGRSGVTHALLKCELHMKSTRTSVYKCSNHFICVFWIDLSSADLHFQMEIINTCGWVEPPNEKQLYFNVKTGLVKKTCGSMFQDVYMMSINLQISQKILHSP